MIKIQLRPRPISTFYRRMACRRGYFRQIIKNLEKSGVRSGYGGWGGKDFHMKSCIVKFTNIKGAIYIDLRKLAYTNSRFLESIII